jgi:hypothetical protein
MTFRSIGVFDMPVDYQRGVAISNFLCAPLTRFVTGTRCWSDVRYLSEAQSILYRLLVTVLFHEFSPLIHFRHCVRALQRLLPGYPLSRPIATS